MEIASQSYSATPTPNTFLYNGKEYDQNTGFYQYGFRQYDAAIGRWHVVDALSKKYYSTSPYAYVSGNPVAYFDVLGLSQLKTTYGQEFWQEYNSLYGSKPCQDFDEWISSGSSLTFEEYKASARAEARRNGYLDTDAARRDGYNFIWRPAVYEYGYKVFSTKTGIKVICFNEVQVAHIAIKATFPFGLWSKEDKSSEFEIGEGNQFLQSNNDLRLPEIRSKFVYSQIEQGAFSVQAYSMIRTKPGNSNVTLTFSQNKNNLISTKISGPLFGSFNIGANGNLTLGFGLISAGFTPDLKYILDVQHPWINGKTEGMTFQWDPQNTIDFGNFILEHANEGMSRFINSPIIFGPIPTLPALIFAL